MAFAGMAVSDGRADATTTAKVNAGTLTVKSDGTAHPIALGIKATTPDVLRVDVGDDGRTDFAFKRDNFDHVVVRAGGGDDDVRIDESGAVSTDTGADHALAASCRIGGGARRPRSAGWRSHDR